MKYDVIEIAGIPLNVATPESLDEARAGLLQVAHLPDHIGLSYNPCPVLHTFGMSIPLDLLWLDSNGTLLGFDEDVTPGNVIVPRSVWGIEVMGGWVRRNLR